MMNDFERFFTPDPAVAHDETRDERLRGVVAQCAPVFAQALESEFGVTDAEPWSRILAAALLAAPPNLPPESPAPRQVAEVFLASARPFCQDADWPLSHQRILDWAWWCQARRQQRAIACQAALISETVIAEIRAIAMDFSEPGQALRLEELELSLFGMLADWGEIEASRAIVLETAFTTQFLRQVVARHSAANRLWELLLLKLERVINEQVAGHRDHILGAALETLVGAVPRFGFFKDFCQRVSGNFAWFAAPVEDGLLLRMAFAAHPEGRLSGAVQRAREPWPWADAVDPSDLAIALRQGRKKLRFGWERTQLDWYDQAVADLQRVLACARACQRAGLAAPNWGREVTETMLTAPDPAAAEALAKWVPVTLAAASAWELPQAIPRLRAQLALYVVHDAPLWRHGEALGRALTRFPLGEAAAEIQEDFLALCGEIPLMLAEFQRIPAHWEGAVDSPLARMLSLGLPVLRRLHDGHHVLPALRGYCAQWLEVQADPPPGEALGAQTLALAGAADDPTHATLRALAPIWPELRAALTLRDHLKNIALLTSSHVLAATPEYAERVGEAGMQSCIRDNHFSLLRAVQILSSPIAEPKSAMLWWWNTAVGAYLVNRAKPTLEANLIGMDQALRQYLPEPEAEAVSSLLQAVFTEALGASLPRSHDAPELRELPLQGVLWRQIFQQPRPGPAMADRALTEWRAAASGFPAASLEARVVALCAAHAEALRGNGDREAAWLPVQPLIADLLARHSAAEIDAAWRAALLRLPLPNTADQAAWLSIGEEGRAILQRAALGQALARKHRTLAKHVSASVLRLGNLADTQRRVTEKAYIGLFSAFFRHAAATLGDNVESLAILSQTRYLLEHLVPTMGLPRLIWQMAWTQLEDHLLAELDARAHPALHRWIAQLDAVATGLEAAVPICREVIAAPEARFAEDEPQEAQWRALFSGWIAAAATPEDAPMPGSALAQRLLLSNEVMRDETPESWGERHAALREAFAEWLPEPLATRLDETQQILARQLGWLAEVFARAGWRNVDPYYLLLHRLPACRAQWWLDQWTASEADLPTAFVCEHTGWSRPRDLAQARERFEAARTFPGLANSVQWPFWNQPALELCDVDQDSLRFFILRLAVQEAAEPPLLVDCLGALTARARDRYPSVLTALRQRIRRLNGANHPLTHALAQALQPLPTTGLAMRLLNDTVDLADLAVRELQPFREIPEVSRQADHRIRCARDFRLILRRLGLHLAGIAPCADLGAWYWERAGGFLTRETRLEAEWWIPKLPDALREILSLEEKRVLEEQLASITRLFSTPAWRSADAKQLEAPE